MWTAHHLGGHFSAYTFHWGMMQLIAIATTAQTGWYQLMADFDAHDNLPAIQAVEDKAMKDLRGVLWHDGPPEEDELYERDRQEHLADSREYHKRRASWFY